ncbi:MAG: L,D-transpeptidase [Xanthobacteraceae bacterium]|nr:L,D-transpeptidase [Xanthobacteraceae bacterium]QYK44951.1 MAG: L,D-transpeptidase [Xanthobacteraceae bacterium]
MQHLVKAALALAFLFAVILTANARELVAFDNAPAGVIIIKTNERALYLTLGDGRALRYKVAVGQRRMQWFGTRYIDGKYMNPAWSPPPEVKRDFPNMPDVIEGGAPNNPMGNRALTLSGGEYAIHGTNRPKSVGQFASYGCFRMYNDDIADLFARVRVGTPVIVTR